MDGRASGRRLFRIYNGIAEGTENGDGNIDVVSGLQENPV